MCDVSNGWESNVRTHFTNTSVGLVYTEFTNAREKFHRACREPRAFDINQQVFSLVLLPSRYFQKKIQGLAFLITL